MPEITKIERLDGKNYQSWKYNIKLVLMERGLWRFVEGTEAATGASAAAKDRFLINWDELTFAKTSGIVTGDALVSYWPVFPPVPSNSPRNLRGS